MNEYKYLKAFEDEYAKDNIRFHDEWISDKIDESFINFAEILGAYLVKPKGDIKHALTTSQIRNIYEEVKRIQLGGFSNLKTSFLLLKPKLSYNIKRNSNKDKGLGLQVFGDVFNRAFDIISNEQNATKQANDFENLCQVLEAIVAFHRGKGGN